MKVILVSGDDFAAIKFEEHFKGYTVQDVIDSGLTEVDEEDYFLKFL